jgi:hypothetical protein
MVGPGEAGSRERSFSFQVLKKTYANANPWEGKNMVIPNHK